MSQNNPSVRKPTSRSDIGVLDGRYHVSMAHQIFEQAAIVKPVLPKPWEKTISGNRRGLFAMAARSTACEKIAPETIAGHLLLNSWRIRL